MTIDLYAVFFFLIGSMVGSFLNVCIVRMPKEKSVVRPRSHCVKCQNTIPWYDNIPFISFLLLRGKCRFCAEKISWRYFLVELVTACFFVLVYQFFGLSILLIPYFIMISGLIVATFVDIDHRIIPDEISVGGMLVGLGASFLIPRLHDVSASGLEPVAIAAAVILALNILLSFFHVRIAKNFVQEDQEIDQLDNQENSVDFSAIIIGVMAVALAAIVLAKSFFTLNANIISLGFSLSGALIAGGSIYLMGLIGDFIFRKESMGGGDIKLMGMIGAFLGWQSALLAFFIAPFFGAILGIIVKIRTKESLIPYGPFLALGAVIALFYSKDIIVWILRGYGFH